MCQNVPKRDALACASRPRLGLEVSALIKGTLETLNLRSINVALCPTVLVVMFVTSWTPIKC